MRWVLVSPFPKFQNHCLIAPILVSVNKGLSFGQKTSALLKAAFKYYRELLSIANVAVQLCTVDGLVKIFRTISFTPAGKVKIPP